MLRKTGLALISLIVAVSLVLLAFLIPAHLQVRSVDSPLPDMDALASLQREDGPTALYFVNTAEQQLPDNILVHSVFVVEWADGRLFAIDLGMTPDRAVEFGALLQIVLNAGETTPHGSIATLLGDDLARLHGVGFTHLHIDHTQAVDELCESLDHSVQLVQVYNQRFEHNFNTSEGADLLETSCLNKDTIEGRYLSQHHDYPGLGILNLGGHTPGSTLFAVWMNDDLFLLSGDTTNTIAEVRQNLGKGFAYSYLMVPEATERTEELRRWLKTMDDKDHVAVVVSHDLQNIIASGIRPFYGE